MVSAALRSARLAPAPPPAAFYLADDVARYKPAAEIYAGLLRRLAKEASPAEVCLVSRCAPLRPAARTLTAPPPAATRSTSSARARPASTRSGSTARARAGRTG